MSSLHWADFPETSARCPAGVGRTGYNPTMKDGLYIRKRKAVSGHQGAPLPHSPEVHLKYKNPIHSLLDQKLHFPRHRAATVLLGGDVKSGLSFSTPLLNLRARVQVERRGGVSPARGRQSHPRPGVPYSSRDISGAPAVCPALLCILGTW